MPWGNFKRDGIITGGVEGGLGYSVAQRTWWGGGWKDRTQDRVCGEITLKTFEEAIWKPVMVKFS